MRILVLVGEVGTTALHCSDQPDRSPLDMTTIRLIGTREEWSAAWEVLVVLPEPEDPSLAFDCLQT